MPAKPFRRIIVIDDEKACLVLARLVLAPLMISDRILTFQTVEEALAFIEQSCLNEGAASSECPDLILLDLQMPGQDGFDFLEGYKIVKQKGKIEAKVLLLTSSEHPRDLERAAMYQLRAYNVKPLSEEKVRRFLATKEKWWN